MGWFNRRSAFIGVHVHLVLLQLFTGLRYPGGRIPPMLAEGLHTIDGPILLISLVPVVSWVERVIPPLVDERSATDPEVDRVYHNLLHVSADKMTRSRLSVY